MNLIKKAWLFWQKEGMKNTLKRIVEKVYELIVHSPGVILEIVAVNYFYRQIEQKVNEKDVYVIIPCIDWNIPLYQRPHQIATVLSEEPDAHVFFISDEYRYDNFAGIAIVKSHLDLLSWRIVPKIGKAFKKARNVTVLMSWPRHADLLGYIPYHKFIYEYIDDLSLFYYYTEDMKKKHYELIRDADLTVCTARVLFEDAKPIARNILLSPNAGDYYFFHDNRSCLVHPELTEKINKYDCVIGYYGCLASWFDYDLIIEVAMRMTNWCFLLVGYCFDGSIVKLQEVALDNIILYPAQPYKKLPGFVAAFDIQTIPFVINDITNATSPVKLFEYMATGKPILTSAIPECLQYKSVTTYQSPDDFIEKVNYLMQIRNDAGYVLQMDEEARNNTWQSRVNEILNAINGGK